VVLCLKLGVWRDKRLIVALGRLSLLLLGLLGGLGNLATGSFLLLH